jgi:1-acyl-sn-glycerol-3-phosphate acyltransferase
MEKKAMLRSFLRGFVRFLVALLTRLETEGLENVPAEGGAILAANHLSRIDSPLIFALIERKDVTGLVADKYQNNVLLRPLIDAVGGIWINREQADFQALRAAMEFLQNGGLLGIAPEGTRSRTGALRQAKTGVAYLAYKAGVPIIPVAIWGTEKTFKELKCLRRAHIKVRVGKPFILPPLNRGDRSGSLQKNTDELVCRIAALLPSEYRGVYADHPRLQELLAGA